jgi:hypothetical protein
VYLSASILGHANASAPRSFRGDTIDAGDSDNMRNPTPYSSHVAFVVVVTEDDARERAASETSRSES